MSAGSIFIGIAMLMVAIPFVANPLIKGARKGSPTDITVEQKSAGEIHAEDLLALRDLEFDFQTGKITEEDYANLHATLMIQAAATLEQQEKQDAELDARLEQAIRLRREKQSKSTTCSQCDAPLDSTDRFCHRCGNPVEATCPKCGGKLSPLDLFCSNCGSSLSAAKTPAAAEGSS